jgi:hypothetical protein
VVASLGAQAAAIRPRGEIDQFVRSLGHDGISHAAIPRAEYSVPADLADLEAEINSSDAAAGIRRKVYGNSGGSGGAAGSGGGSGGAAAAAAAAKKEVLTIDSLSRAEQLADQANANAPPPPSIPRAFAALTEAIRPNLGVEGIFRISAGATELAALRTQVCARAGSVAINCHSFHCPQVETDDHCVSALSFSRLILLCFGVSVASSLLFTLAPRTHAHSLAQPFQTFKKHHPSSLPTSPL